MAPKTTYLKDLKDPKGEFTLRTLAASLLHWRAGSLRSFTAIRTEAALYCGSFLRKGEVFANVGRNQNLEDLKMGQNTKALLKILSVHKFKILQLLF